MSRANRGGMTLKTGKIGRVNCIRQQLMMPGERMNININGNCRLEALRERDVMRINAHLGVFMTPLRWLWSDFPQYLKEGPDTAVTPPVGTASNDWSNIGIGSYQLGHSSDYYQFWENAYLRVYNEWYKWPEAADATVVPEAGEKAVPLAKAWNRCRYDATPDDSGDYTVSSATNFDVRDLAQIQARFRSAMKRDVLSYNRWMELIDEVYKGDGSREVDQVPILLDSIDVGVNPREMPATDGASLGTWQSLFDFNINHSINGVVAPEHCVITYMLTVRFASVIEGNHPLGTNRLDWYELTADPEYISSAKPVDVVIRDIQQGGSAATSLGYLPAGWQWRCDHDIVGKAIDVRDTFPYMLVPTTQAEAKDATRVVDAFRSSALDDYIVDVFIKEDSYQPIGDSMDSYFSGMIDEVQTGVGGRNEEFPKGGKML